jgi:hypothetical protein
MTKTTKTARPAAALAVSKGPKVTICPPAVAKGGRSQQLRREDLKAQKGDQMSEDMVEKITINPHTGRVSRTQVPRSEAEANAKTKPLRAKAPTALPKAEKAAKAAKADAPAKEKAAKAPAKAPAKEKAPKAPKAPKTNEADDKEAAAAMAAVVNGCVGAGRQEASAFLEKIEKRARKGTHRQRLLRFLASRLGLRKPVTDEEMAVAVYGKATGDQLARNISALKNVIRGAKDIDLPAIGYTMERNNAGAWEVSLLKK